MGMLDLDALCYRHFCGFPWCQGLAVFLFALPRLFSGLLWGSGLTYLFGEQTLRISGYLCNFCLVGSVVNLKSVLDFGDDPGDGFFPICWLPSVREGSSPKNYMHLSLRQDARV